MTVHHYNIFHRVRKKDSPKSFLLPSKNESTFVFFFLSFSNASIYVKIKEKIQSNEIVNLKNRSYKNEKCKIN